MDKKQYSKELKDVINYISDTLSTEFYTDVFTPEYLIVSILDNKKCHANMILDNFLMSDNINEFREIYAEELRKISQETPNISRNSDNEAKGHMKFSPQLNKIMEMAVVESDKLNAQTVNSEHVLLSILNPSNEIREREVFSSVGLYYDFILSKCKEQDTKSNPR